MRTKDHEYSISTSNNHLQTQWLEYLLASFPLKKKACKNWRKRRYALPNIYSYKINLRLSKEWSRSFLYINAIASWSCWVGEFPTNIFEVYFRARCQHISKYLHKPTSETCYEIWNWILHILGNHIHEMRVIFFENYWKIWVNRIIRLWIDIWYDMKREYRFIVYLYISYNTCYVYEQG